MDIEQKTIACLRALVIDMTNKANSGHPGMALDAAPALYALYHDHYRMNIQNPNDFNRDRFVLSSGHVSALLYALLAMCHLLKMEDLEAFRQLGSMTPGHPEYGLTPGVDATAGPLGQGIAQAVGMAVAEKKHRLYFHQGNHYIYCLCGDGCLEEGISQEAISFAGLQELSHLILLYDENESTLDAPTSHSMKEDVAKRFQAANWNVIKVENGEDHKAISEAISKAKESESKPTLILFHTKIGYGSPLEGSNKAHGTPLGEENGAKTKENLGISWSSFTIPSDCQEDFDKARAKLIPLPVSSLGNEEMLKKNSLNALENVALKESESTRSISGRILEAMVKSSPYWMGGSADVASSVMTKIKDDPSFFPTSVNGQNIEYGIREFAMAAINNGILLHGGIRCYGGCFLVFSDYMKNAIRMSALEKLPAIYLFSHDSLAVGEDGPTHQPIEQLVALRSIPNLVTIRPADGKEMKGAYKEAILSEDHPVALILSRQNLPLLDKTSEEKTLKGAYLIKESENPTMEILASGSEVSLALDVASMLEEKGERVLVASFPSMELFRKQETSYQKKVLPLPYHKRFALEMLSPFMWHEWAKYPIGVNRFGASGKMKDVEEAFGWTKEKITAKIVSYLKKEEEIE